MIGTKAVMSQWILLSRHDASSRAKFRSPRSGACTSLRKEPENPSIQTFLRQLSMIQQKKKLDK
jgi:hypothetical protein